MNEQDRKALQELQDAVYSTAGILHHAGWLMKSQAAYNDGLSTACREAVTKLQDRIWELRQDVLILDNELSEVMS